MLYLFLMGCTIPVKEVGVHFATWTDNQQVADAVQNTSLMRRGIRQSEIEYSQRDGGIPPRWKHKYPTTHVWFWSPMKQSIPCHFALWVDAEAAKFVNREFVMLRKSIVLQ